MLLSERLIQDDDKLVHVRQFNHDPVLKRASDLRSAGIEGFGENRLVGAITTEILGMWLQEAGVEWHDTGAVQEVLRKKLLSGEFSKLRVHEGTF